MKLEIASILRDAADRIAAIEETLPTPALPEPPEDYVLLGKGGEFKIPSEVFKGATRAVGMFGQWDIRSDVLNGKAPSLWYAAPIGSDIARLNGIEPQAIPADKPERKAREWHASVSPGGSFLASLGEYSEPITVREILPGEPTMEQIEELVHVAKMALQYLPEGRFCAMSKALAPFRK